MILQSVRRGAVPLARTGMWGAGRREAGWPCLQEMASARGSAGLLKTCTMTGICGRETEACLMGG